MAPSYTQAKLEFGAKLKTARQAARMSQERAAAAVGTSRRHWIRWESGETSPNPAYLDRIASVLDDPSLADSDDDDEESSPTVQTLDDFLRARVRELIAAERHQGIVT